jgi:hypothetical protein
MSTTRRNRDDSKQDTPQRDARSREAPPRQEDVARRAYELYEQRGGEPGHDQDDWFAAERELRERE